MYKNTSWPSALVRARSHGPQGGFTLIELMIVVVIVGILAAIAYPSYVGYINKTKRKAAEACLYEYANYMERIYTNNLTYRDDAGLPTLSCATESQTGSAYSYRFADDEPTDSTYVIEAVPASDTNCGTLSLNQSGQRGASGDDVSACW